MPQKRSRRPSTQRTPPSGALLASARAPKPASRFTEFSPENMPHLVGYQLRRAHVAVFKKISTVMGQHRIAPGHFGVLLTIYLYPDQTQSWIASECGMDRSTLVPIVQNLEANGYVRRNPRNADRRAYSLQVTARGERLMYKLGPELQAYENFITRKLTDQECRTLVSLLRKLEASA